MSKSNSEVLTERKDTELAVMQDDQLIQPEGRNLDLVAQRGRLWWN